MEFIDWERDAVFWGVENNLSFDLGGVTWFLDTQTRTYKET